MEWRLADDSDLPMLARWNRQLQEDEGAAVMSLANIEARLRRWLGTSYAAIVFEPERPVGYALYRPTDPDLEGSGGVYLRQFFIDRDARRSGFGSAAFATLARDVIRGQRLVLEVLASNPGGRAFWLSLGLVEYCTTYHLPERR